MLTWTTEKPTQTGWYWYRKDPVDASMLLYCGATWDHIVDFAGLNDRSHSCKIICWKANGLDRWSRRRNFVSLVFLNTAKEC
jgi:hypothetical protein